MAQNLPYFKLFGMCNYNYNDYDMKILMQNVMMGITKYERDNKYKKIILHLMLQL